jgi:hypothetical protein
MAIAFVLALGNAVFAILSAEGTVAMETAVNTTF